MFKYWKEMRELKLEKLRYTTYLLGVASEFILKYKKTQSLSKASDVSDEDAMAILKKLQSTDIKDAVNPIVDFVKEKANAK